MATEAAKKLVGPSLIGLTVSTRWLCSCKTPALLVFRSRSFSVAEIYGTLIGLYHLSKLKPPKIKIQKSELNIAAIW